MLLLGLFPRSPAFACGYQISISDCPAGWLPEGGESQGNYVEFTAGDNPGFTIGGGGLTASKANVTTATVKVRCYDYGAWGSIKAEMVGGPSSETKKMPVDSNGNNIGDSWGGNDGAAGDDNETDPAGDGTNGDGFSRYEEYRGFMCNGSDARIDHTKKNVFVCDVNSLGTDDLGATGLVIRLLKSDGSEYNAYREVNFKYESHHNAYQCVIKLLEWGWSELYYGTASAVGTPNQVLWVNIYTQRIRWDGPPTQDTTTWDPNDLEMKKSVIGHECGHDVNIQHHAGGGCHQLRDAYAVRLGQHRARLLHAGA